MKMITYFGVGRTDAGKDKLWLSPTNWFDVVPEDLTQEEAGLLSQAIAQKHVLLGKKWIPALDKDKEVKKSYILLLKKFRGCTDQFKDPIRSLVLKKKEGNYTATELIRAMLAAENGAGARPDFIAFLNDALSHCAGPVSLVEDSPTDPENYSVTVDPITRLVTSHTKRIPEGEEQEMKDPTPILDDPQKRASKIENAFD